MKQKALTLAVRHIVCAGFGLSAAVGTSAYAQSAPSAGAAAAPAAASGAAAAAPASGTAAAITTAQATTAPTKADNGTAKLKTFTVTGSLIRQSDKTGFQQVQVVTSQDIRQSGQQSVADFLRSISANSANSWGESNDDSFAAGASGIALRGLSEKYTLVLVDGQRVAPYAFAVNGTDQFFDLNTLPLNIIDRIEIVKTGAVSQYGSDAIAGVVNIITKHDYQGLQLDANQGFTTQGGGAVTKFGVLGGFGNLTSDRFNVTAAASYYKDNGFTLADRDTTKDQYFGQFPLGSSIQSPSYWLNPTTGLAEPGPCIGGTVVPASANGIAAAGAAGAAGGNVCQHNTANSASIQPFSERYNAKVHADFKVNDSTTAWADVSGSHISTKTDDFGLSIGSGLVYNPATGGMSVFQPVVPGSNPFNPYGQDASFFGWVPGTYSMKTEAEYLRLSTGIKGSFALGYGDWDWALSYGHSQSNVANAIDGSISIAGLKAMLQNGTYNFNNPASTPNGLNGVFTQTNSIGVSKLDVADATLSTPTLFHLPTGDVGLGLGTQFQHQSQFISPGANTLDGSVLSPALQSVEGERNVAAVYYQVDVPLWHEYLSFNQSGRYDRYSDFGGVYSPRFALRLQPVKELTTYASYSRGFRAPEFLENSASTSTGLMPVGPNGEYETVVTTGNTKLQPERTKNYNIGFQLSPARNTDVGFDWYKIHVDKVIGTAINPAGTVLNPDGTIAFMSNTYENLGSFDTSGFEFTFRQALQTGIGTFTLSGDWAYVYHFYMNPGNGGATQDGAGNDLTLAQPFGGSFPRWKGNTQLDWMSPSRKLDVALAWQFTGPYTDTLLNEGIGSNFRTASYSQFNLNFTYTGFKNWTIYGGVNNIFDRSPPFDPLWVGSIDQTGYDQSLYTYVGRFVQVGATYKF